MSKRDTKGRDDALESGEHFVEPRAELSLMTAYNRHPGRWTKNEFLAASRVPGAFSNMTADDAVVVLDTIARVCRAMGVDKEVPSAR